MESSTVLSMGISRVFGLVAYSDLLMSLMMDFCSTSLKDSRIARMMGKWWVSQKSGLSEFHLWDKIHANSNCASLAS